jgi:LmbE family N-acetylglucosaminyl deacetylase
MLNLIPNKGKLKILCLGAHSDDIEIGCGGTLLKIFENYDIEQVEWVVFATNDQRKIEAENSAKEFLKGVSNYNITVEKYRDGFLPFIATQIKEEFEAIKPKIAPDIVFTHYRHDRHQDHRLVSELTWNTFRNHLILEYEIPKWDGDIGNPNFYVEISEELLLKKNKLMKESFITQTSKHWFDDETFKSLPRIRGMESACRYAEAFYSRKTTIF